MPSSLSGETQASRREVTWPRSPTNQREALVPAQPQPPPDFFLKRGSWWSEVSGERNYTPQRLCLYQGWGLERDRDSKRQGRESPLGPRSFSGQGGKPPGLHNQGASFSSGTSTQPFLRSLSFYSHCSSSRRAISSSFCKDCKQWHREVA